MWKPSSIFVFVSLVALLAGCGGTSKGAGGQARTRDRTRDVRPAPHSVSAQRGVSWWVPSRPIAGVQQRTVGEGADAAVVLWRSGRRPPRDAVIFLHGYEPEPPSVGAYRGWIRHLTAQGDSVVYPVYQTVNTRPEGYLANAVAGIHAGLSAVRANPASVVAIGHTTGGALVFDYAAVAQAEGLPAPRAVIAVYPGRHPTAGFEVTPVELSRIPAGTRLMAIAGPGDPLPRGDQEARALLEGATQVPAALRSFTSAPYVRSPGPFPMSVVPRRSFWAPTDRLIVQARAGAR